MLQVPPCIARNNSLRRMIATTPTKNKNKRTNLFKILLIKKEEDEYSNAPLDEVSIIEEDDVNDIKNDFDDGDPTQENLYKLVQLQLIPTVVI